MTADPRRGKPSASGFYRDFHCHANRQLSRHIAKSPAGPDADFGTVVHAVLAGQQEARDEAVQECVDKCTELEGVALAQIMDAIGTQELPKVEREQRLWFRDEYSGQFDLLWVWPQAIAVLDYKTGRNPAQAAEVNMQLRALLAIESQRAGLMLAKRRFGAIIQPNCYPPYSIVEYSANENGMAVRQLEETIAGLNDPSSQPRAGDWCRYCPANDGIHCPATASQLPVVAEKLELMTGEKIAEVLRIFDRAEDTIKTGREYAKRLLSDNPSAIPGWHLKPGAVRESIVDPLRVWQRVSQLGVTQQAFLDAVTVTKGKLKDAVKEGTGNKGKELDALMAEVLDGLTEQKQTAPSLEEDKV